MEKQSFFRVQKKNVEEEKYVICIKDELASKEEFNTREEAEQYIETELNKGLAQRSGFLHK